MGSQANLERLIRHEKQVETRISDQRAKIARIRSQGRSVDRDEMELELLLRTLEVLKKILATITDPTKGGNLSH